MNDSDNPMPPKIAAAVTQVMEGIAKLERDETNPHARYRYAGIESFLEMTRPLMARAGLVIVQDEESYDFVTTRNKQGEERTWLVVLFSFTLIHSSGETWGRQLKRTGMADASMGSQAFGAAQSYALKQFNRSLFLIATGDSEDADSHPQADLPRMRSGNAVSRLGKKVPPIDKMRAELSQSLDPIEKEFANADSEESVKKIWGKLSVPDMRKYESVKDKAKRRLGLSYQSGADKD